MEDKLQKTWSVLARLANGLFDDFDSWFEKLPTAYTADFMRHEELSRFNCGISIGAKATSKKLAHAHTILFAQSGGGKTTSVIAPSIISLARGKSTIIVNDIKSGEVYDMVSHFLNAQGYDIYRYNFRDSRYSESFNPLHLLESESDINLVAELIYANAQGDSKEDPFWRHSSTMLLALFIKVLFYQEDKKYLTLQNVLKMVERLSYDPRSLDRLFARSKDEDLISAYKSTISMSEKTMASVIQTLRTVLRCWQDKEICKTTATNSLSFSKLRERPTAVFLTTPIKDLQYTRPITALLISSLFNFVLSGKAEQESRSIFFLLDEFSAYVFPDFSSTISTCRAMNCGMVLAMQDENALIARYGPHIAHVIKTNCSTQIYFPNMPLSTASALSQILGKRTIQTDSSEKIRELLTPSEIRQLDKAIVLIKNNPAMLVKMVPYFENVWMRPQFNKPPYTIPAKESITLPILSFD